MISVENLSKHFVLSHQEEPRRYKTLRDSMMYYTTKMFSSKGSKKTSAGGATKEEFKALNDVSFKVEKGERVG